MALIYGSIENNTKALLHNIAKNDPVPISPHRAGGRGINLKTAYIQTPRSRGDSPKEIHPSNQGISFGEKGAGRRKIEVQARFDVNFIVSCRFDCFTSMKPYRHLEPKASDGAAARTARIAYAPTLPPFGLQSGGQRFRNKEPERRGKAVG